MWRRVEQLHFLNHNTKHQSRWSSPSDTVLRTQGIGGNQSLYLYGPQDTNVVERDLTHTHTQLDVMSNGTPTSIIPSTEQDRRCRRYSWSFSRQVESLQNLP
ncbi:hypothetical protein Pcinc_004583 [Petrolisthes cinctipes]|uniref:Uncharacterized protein n=1 Tax=Petrolisthes cinctipes TaxID=88211 RepID=A0AAE1GE74_PETCI|nr:hypothetical protein Pcinc_004583 [Petrolisthes cinctipes]